MKNAFRKILSTLITISMIVHQQLAFAVDAKSDQERMDAVTKPIVDAVEKATLGGDNSAEYKQELQKDIIMVIIGQTTARLNVCSSAPDMKMAIAAGSNFMNGEIAEYIKTQALQAKMKEIIVSTKKYDEQIEYLVTLRKEYATVLASTEKKNQTRTLSKDAFLNAATLAANETIEVESLAKACQDHNNSKVQSGQGQANNQIMIFLALAAMYYSYPYCAGCAAAAAVLALKLLAEDDEKSCNAGGTQTNNYITQRQFACNELGTYEMFKTSESPTTTASKTIYDNCISAGTTVSGNAGSGCKGYSGNGAGPYSSCDMALDAYKRNMVHCPVSVFNPASNIDPVKATGVTAGVVSGVSIDFILSSTQSLARALDLRMASPYQRTIVWKAFANLTEVAIATNEGSIAKIKANIEKLDKLIAELMRLKNGNPTTNAVATGISPIVTPETDTTTPNINGSGSSSNMIHKGLSSSLDSSKSFVQASAYVQDISSKIAVELENKDYSSSDKLNSGLSSADQKSRSKAILDAYKAKARQLETYMKSQGKNVNIDQEASKLSKELLTAVAKDSGKISGFSNAVASYSSGIENTSTTASDASGSVDKAKLQLEAPNFTIPTANPDLAMPSFNNGTKAATSADKKTTTTSDASTAESEENIVIENAITARDQKKDDKYNSKEEDSIFTKLTKAYIRNYDKVLKKKEKIQLGN